MLESEQGLDQPEQPGQHGIFGEVLLHFLFGKRIALLAQFLARVTDVPCLQFFQSQLGSSEFAQFFQVFFRKRLGALRQFEQELGHLCRRVGHLARQRKLGVIGEAQHLRLFRAQLQYLRHQRRVVPVPLSLTFRPIARWRAWCKPGTYVRAKRGCRHTASPGRRTALSA